MDNGHMDNLTKTLKDTAYVVFGFGVLGFQKAQVRRQELTKQLKEQRGQVETQLSGARQQLNELVRTLDGAIEPVRVELEGRLDRVEEHLPAQAKDVVKSARALAKETEQHVRRAVGAA
jgi:ElaB/YqjD/DUF883 family membrane-anchored ribosome-binding protein